MKKLISCFSHWQVGDKLAMVNGHNVEVCDHYEAVNIMREAGSQLRLVVTREEKTIAENVSINYVNDCCIRVVVGSFVEMIIIIN